MIGARDSGRVSPLDWRASHILVKSRGGDLGWFGPGKMVRAFEEAVSRLGNGSLSEVVSTQFGHHLIKKTGQR